MIRCKIFLRHEVRKQRCPAEKNFSERGVKLLAGLVALSRIASAENATRNLSDRDIVNATIDTARDRLLQIISNFQHNSAPFVIPFFLVLFFVAIMVLVSIMVLYHYFGEDRSGAKGVKKVGGGGGELPPFNVEKRSALLFLKGKDKSALLLLKGEKKDDLLLRTESLLLNIHDRYLKGEIPEEEYRELIKKNTDLIYKIRKKMKH